MTGIGLVLALMAHPVQAQQAGWHFSPLPGEGDRASLGCARDSTATEFTCLAVRCEDDYATGIHVHSSRAGGAEGRWAITLDREDRVLDTTDAPSPYGARLADPEGWLLDGLQHGTFVYLRHQGDAESGFAYIDLAGSFRAIREALYWCAPRNAPDEQNPGPGVETRDDEGERR